MIPKCPNQVFLWYRLVKYQENTDRYQTKIPNRDATLDFSVTAVQIFRHLTFTKQKKGRKYDPVYNLGAYNYPNNTNIVSLLPLNYPSSVLAVLLHQADLRRYLFWGRKGMFLCFYVKKIGACGHPLKIPQFFRKGIRVPLY
jgi:hypothetical protein